MASEFRETEELLSRASKQSRQELLAKLFTAHRGRLRLLAELRLDRRLRRRVDPSDAVQEAYLEASRRLEGYLKKPLLPFFLWLRFLTRQKVQEIHRRHLAARKRDVRLEATRKDEGPPDASSESLSDLFVKGGTSPSEAAQRAELKLLLLRALESMEPIDREVLALRHFEQLSNADAARELGIEEETAKKRYSRALKRLKQMLGSLDRGSPAAGH